MPLKMSSISSLLLHFIFPKYMPGLPVRYSHNLMIDLDVRFVHL